MSTKKNLRLDPKAIAYKGLVDSGDGAPIKDVGQMADHGLVFVFQPLIDDYAQPIAVFISKGPTPGVTQAKLIIQDIVLLERAGAKVHGVVTDGATTNRKFWSEVGCSGKLNDVRNSFPHPTIADREIYIFSDTPHLIKCILKRLFEKGQLQTESNADLIKWDYFSKLFEIDRQSCHGRLCPKLTQNHISPNNLLKMRVSLAIQIFSKATASGLLNYKDYHPELEGCESTAEFCLRIDRLFDSLNRTKPETGPSLQSGDFSVLQ